MTKRDLYSELSIALQEAKDHTNDKVTIVETKTDPEKVAEERDTDGKVE